MYLIVFVGSRGDSGPPGPQGPDGMTIVIKLCKINFIYFKRLSLIYSMHTNCQLIATASLISYTRVLAIHEHIRHAQNFDMHQYEHK